MKTMQDKTPVDIERYKLVRERWDKEDDLLLSRTGIFLTANSILIAALGFQENNLNFQKGISVLGLLLSLLWLATSIHSGRVIRKLFLLCKDHIPYDLKEIMKIKPVLFRPTTVFCKLIPGLIVAVWLAALVWLATFVR